jgi:NAD(P)H-dependent FMN reductase
MNVTGPDAPERIHAGTLLGISTSLKPAPGVQGRSAARSLLAYALGAVSGVYPEVSLLDLRDHPPPFFDGRFPGEREDPDLRFVWSCVDRAGALLLSVTAYWAGVSGVFKNLVDVLCGPVYDLAEPTPTVFAGKPAGLLVVGADAASARAGAEQAQQILASVAARLVAPPVVVANPRAGGIETEALAREIVALAGELARSAHAAGTAPLEAGR